MRRVVALVGSHKLVALSEQLLVSFPARLALTQLRNTALFALSLALGKLAGAKLS
jgi:hypothetical protein